MRQFQFRLAPVQRLKNYQIEQKEQEAANLESQVQQKLREIEEGRQAVQTMRRKMLEQHENVLQAEQQMDLFRTYMNKVEAQKRSEIRGLREQQEKKRKELLKLYQEEKILQRYREKKEQDWNKEMRKEENAQMDEIGAQGFNKRQREGGGVLLYLLVPLALAGTAALIGFYTGFLDKEMLKNIPFIGQQVRSATQPAQVASATEPEEFLTVGDILGDMDQPMPEMMQNITNQLERIRQRQAELNERERQLNRREQLVQQREQQLAALARQVTQSIQTLQNLRKNREEQLKSEMSERETQLAQMIQSNRPKDIAPTIAAMFQQQPADDPQQARQRQLIILRILHRMEDKNRAELLGEIAGENPQVASELIVQYNNTSMDELYNVEVPDTAQPPPAVQNQGQAPLGQANAAQPKAPPGAGAQGPEGPDGPVGPQGGQGTGQTNNPPTLGVPELVNENGNAGAAGG